MKKMIITWVLAVVLAGGDVLAAGEEIVTREAREAFNLEFPGAEFSKWDKLDDADLYMVRFLYEGTGYVAYVRPAGSIFASARLVNKKQLPYTVDRAIRKRYTYDEISQVDELTIQGGLSYFVTAVHNDRRVILRIYSDGSVERISAKKLKKGF